MQTKWYVIYVFIIHQHNIVVEDIRQIYNKKFFAPYIISFLIAEFILIMQFMWKYIDDFAGRGLSLFDFMKLLLYYGATVIPMAVPITILISSVMVYGNLGEKYELSSMKTAGISLIRIFFPD